MTRKKFYIIRSKYLSCGNNRYGFYYCFVKRSVSGLFCNLALPYRIAMLRSYDVTLHDVIMETFCHRQRSSLEQTFNSSTN